MDQQISDRATDTFDSFEKQRCRLRNLEVVSRYAPWAFTDDGMLRCGWVELMGDTGVLTLKMLEDQQLIGPGGFVGIDLDKERIARFQTRRPDLHWIAADAYRSIAKLQVLKVGILNMDGYGDVGEPKGVNELSALKPLIATSIQLFGGCVLFWNKSLDSVQRRKKKHSAALRAHVANIRQALDGYAPGCQIPDLLPGDCDNLIDSGFVGEAGAFDIYRGKAGGHRMANLRLVL